MKQTTRYGLWRSSVSAAIVAEETKRSDLQASSRGNLYWVEARPEYEGRALLVRHTPDGEREDLTPWCFDVRTRVHEYGGAPYCIGSKGFSEIVYFSNLHDGQIYYQVEGEKPVQLTSEAGLRFSDMVIDEQRDRIICVCEDHTNVDTCEPKNYLASIDLKFGLVDVLWQGDHFYSSPRLSPDGTQVAFLSWNKPHMPWDTTHLSVLLLSEDGYPMGIEIVSSQRDVTFAEPKWSPDGVLYAVSDFFSEWWNLLSWDSETKALRPCHQERGAEFTRPHWVFGMSHYDFTPEGNIVAACTKCGAWRIRFIRLLGEGKSFFFNVPYTEISNIRVRGEYVYFFGASSIELKTLVRLSLSTGVSEKIGEINASRFDLEDVSVSQKMTYCDTKTYVTKTHGLYYPPRNKDFNAPNEELPPCIFMIHGGPTAQAENALSFEILYWTSRGFGVCIVNYRGSTGYGRIYREKLKGNWGRVDVEDCVNGALHLVEMDKIDQNRIIIRGGSAGGYTVLRTLQESPVFRAGGVYYGVSNLRSLAEQTHKFEASYLDYLVGPDSKNLYEKLSLMHPLQFPRYPTIFFHGSEDRVVPPNQSQQMVEVLREKGIPVAYMVFEYEGHGFRIKQNIVTALEAELYFYRRVLGIVEKSKNAPVLIENENNIV